MKLGIRFSLFSLFFFSLLSLIIAVTTANATTHVIEFGGSHGFTYSPNLLAVSVGDTIEWVGDFTSHQLQSVSIPGGALPFGPISSGSSFKYAVTVEGQYGYRCNFHFSLGMVGGFTAGTASVKDESGNGVATLSSNYPNPFAGSTKICYTLANPATVSLKVFDINGKEVINLVSEHQNSGSYEVSFNTGGLVNGTYIYKLQAGDAVLTKQMIVIKD